MPGVFIEERDIQTPCRCVVVVAGNTQRAKFPDKLHAFFGIGTIADNIPRAQGMINSLLLQIINQEASQPGARLDYLFETYIQPVRDYGDAWLMRLNAEGKIAPVSVTLIYFLMAHGVGGIFALPALTKRLTRGAKGHNPRTIRAQVDSAVSVIFDGLVPR